MGWIRRLFWISSKEELEGIRLDVRKPLWEVGGAKSFAELFAALDGWLPEGSVLDFEGGALSEAIYQFMVEHAIPEQTHVAFGTIWPRPKAFHVPATHETLTELAELAEHHAEPELAIHFHVYAEGQIILQWHDAFDEEILLREDIPEGEIREFARRLGTGYKRCVIHDGPV